MELKLEELVRIFLFFYIWFSENLVVGVRVRGRSRRKN